MARGGKKHDLVARLRPDARAEYLRRLAVPVTKPTLRTLHEVVLHGVVAVCTTCGSKMASDQAVAHIFGH